MRRLLCALLLGVAAPGFAQERVIDFHSDITIAADSALHVVETIVVQAEGRQIRRGIYRDFPTDYEDRLGTRVRVGFEVISVTHNNLPATWITQRLANGVRVRVGDPNVHLPRGEHTYVITYRTTRQLGFFELHDELYWNVNGNGWTLPFQRLSAEVRLPVAVPARELKLEAYTGYPRARGRNYQAEARDGGAHFRATTPLPAGAGMTIVLEFPKGIVRRPGMAQRLGWWLTDNRGILSGILGALVLLAFLYWRWHLVGRDPRAGPKFPRYEPPPGLGPAGVRFVDRMAYDDKCFAAALLGLGARGYLKIREHEDEYQIERTGKDVEWLPGERHFSAMLFGPGKALTLKRKHDAGVQATRDAFRRDLELQFNEKLFSRNRGSFALGVLISALTVGAMIYLDTAWESMVALGVVLGSQLLLFSYLLPAYSVPGRKLQDHIEGLRYYLGVAEKDDLARLKAPERTPQEFARFLPYALALDVEKTWADRFAAALGASAVAAAVAHYYSSDTGFGAGSASLGGFSDSISGLGSTVSAASTPPGSSAGGSGGGGGSSGGGGGGGGGGGW